MSMVINGDANHINAMKRSFMERQVLKSSKWGKGNQGEATDRVFDFLLREITEEDESYIFSLFGYAGTGKTFLLCKIIKLLLKNNIIRNVYITAPTHNALRLLKDKFTTFINKRRSEEQGFDPRETKLINGTSIIFATVHSLLGYKMNYRAEDGVKDFDCGSNGEITLKSGSLIITDECSMIGKRMIGNIINMMVTNTRKISVKIIFGGDPCQLPPVNENVNDIVIKCDEKNERFDQYTMSRVIRTNDRDIIGLCKYIRECVNTVRVCNVKKLNEFKNDASVFIYSYSDSWFRKFVKDLRKETSCICLTFKNNTCKTYNDEARKTLFSHIKDYNVDHYYVDDRLLFKEFYYIITPDSLKKKINFYTSEQIKVVAVDVMYLDTNALNSDDGHLDDLANKCIDKMFGMPIGGKLGKIMEDIYVDILVLVDFAFKKINSFYKVWALDIKRLTYADDDDVVHRIYVLYDEQQDDNIKKEREVLREKILPIIAKCDRIITENSTSIRNKELHHDVTQDVWNIYHILLVDPFAIIKYGNASTTHSAQGMTVGKVYVDLRDIGEMKDISDMLRCLYTALSRAQQALCIIV